MDEKPYTYVRFTDGSGFQIEKSSHSVALNEVASYQNNPKVEIAFVRYDLPNMTSFFETPFTHASTAEEAISDDRFKREAVMLAHTTEFEKVPENKKNWLDHIADAARNAETGAFWLRDPLRWKRKWRRLAMCLFPIAFLIWLGVLILLLVAGFLLDLPVRIVMWTRMSFTNFQDWWNLPDNAARPKYVLDVEGDHFDTMTVTPVRKPVEAPAP